MTVRRHKPSERFTAIEWQADRAEDCVAGLPPAQLHGLVRGAARNAPTNAPGVVVLAYLGGIRKCIRIVVWAPLFAVKALKIFLNQ